MGVNEAVPHLGNLYNNLPTISAWASLLGIPIALFGLWWTLLAKRAAKDASEAAILARDAVKKFNTSLDLSIIVAKFKDLGEALDSEDIRKVKSISHDIKTAIARTKSVIVSAPNSYGDRIDNLEMFFHSLTHNFNTVEDLKNLDRIAFSQYENMLIELSESVKGAAYNE